MGGRNEKNKTKTNSESSHTTATARSDGEGRWMNKKKSSTTMGKQFTKQVNTVAARVGRAVVWKTPYTASANTANYDAD